jgi:hypothetical protein
MVLILNPFARIEHLRGQRVLFLMVPVRHRPMAIHQIAYGKDPHLYGVLTGAPAERGPRLDRRDRRRLSALGVLLRSADVPKPTPFSAYLEDLERFLARPRPGTPWWPDAPSRGLTLNARMMFEPRGRLPREVRTSGISAQTLPAGVPTLWVRNPTTHSLFPYHLGERFLARVGPLLRLTATPAALDPTTRSVLQAAGVLVPSRRGHRNADPAGAAALRSARGCFASQGVALLDRVFDPFQASRLSRYLQGLKREGFFGLKDNQSGRWFTHHEPLCAFLNGQLATLVSQVGGRRYHPALTYPVIYRPGDSLPRHRDVPPCEVVLSIQMDHLGATRTNWPLQVERIDKTGAFLPYRTADGDAVLFKGGRLEHRRSPLTGARPSVNLVLCFAARPYDSPLRARRVGPISAP